MSYQGPVLSPRCFHLHKVSLLNFPTRQFTFNINTYSTTIPSLPFLLTLPLHKHNPSPSNHPIKSLYPSPFINLIQPSQPLLLHHLGNIIHERPMSLRLLP